jgi:hypothetical protein
MTRGCCDLEPPSTTRGPGRSQISCHIGARRVRITTTLKPLQKRKKAWVLLPRLPHYTSPSAVTASPLSLGHYTEHHHDNLTSITPAYVEEWVINFVRSLRFDHFLLACRLHHESMHLDHAKKGFVY